MATGQGTTTGRRELLVVLLVGIVVLVTVLVGPLVPRWHDAPAWLALDGALPTPRPGPTGPPQSTGQDRTSLQAPAWVGETVRGLAIATLAVLVFLFLRHVYRLVQQRLGSIDTGGPGDEPAGQEVLDGLDDVTQAALQEGYLDAGRALRDLPPGDAVIAAWLALEHAAGRGGIEREPAETATEFTLALLDRTCADPGAARSLLRLYHRARFSDHEVRPADVAAARAALGALAGALPRPAGTTSDGGASS